MAHSDNCKINYSFCRALCLAPWRVAFVVGAFLLISILPASEAGAAPRGGEAAYEQARRMYFALDRRDPEVSNLLAWEDAAKLFQNYLSAYDGDQHNPEALFNVGSLYEKTYRKRAFRTGLIRSIYYYEELAKRFRGHRLADDALLALGDLRRDALNDEVAARAAYYEIVDEYPQGDQVKNAAKRLGIDPPIAQARSPEPVKRKPEKKPAEEPEENKAEPKKDKQKEPGFLSSLFGGEPKSGEGKEIVSQPRARRGPVIVIDPGHGGEDKGAVGVNGILEKEVVLNISLYFDELLRERLRADTVLTRARDVDVALEGRTQLANNKEADLFISVHANASHRKTARGIETYYLDNTNDKSSLKLAERENLSFPEAQNDLQFIVSDLIQSGKLDDSVSLAHHIQNSLHKTLERYYREVKNLGVKKAPFFVLVGAHMPCVLVEVSFIDHPQEGKLLITRRYQKLIAQALYQGVRDYFESHPWKNS